ncbi:hypothetical protein SYNPS1DRAFT_29632 [Syncephalis pseudoplumigaleata]|uniref:t-SNARE coiled-coil homology domain-containing protein n=1 Tax=Syncephalis pseudoplumigaleata TaxID=1712513 RepID=A0A4P9YX39_9FUNG|nr:hypothetical protein SYNPS1DRAFT_29632 [Syncephalis pseudoplumigaleata]|eukprot:RKP24607.1 hypothetical protein SYNPS1DRAFT_29632 [Syncephalis pseudoplumigaleata]
MSQWRWASQQPQENASNDRNRLLYGHATGVQAGSDAASGPMHRGGANLADAYQQSSEGFSDQRVSGLHNKVAMLREISIGIGEEVREQSRMLNTMVGSTAIGLDGHAAHTHIADMFVIAA